MKLFSIEEANSLIPVLRPKLLAIQRLYAHVDVLKDEARAAASASEFGGGMTGGTSYVNMLYQIGKLTTEMADAGVEMKDYSRGLIDFRICEMAASSFSAGSLVRATRSNGGTKRTAGLPDGSACSFPQAFHRTWGATFF